MKKTILLAIVASIIVGYCYNKNRKEKEFDEALQEIKDERIKYRGNDKTTKHFSNDEIAYAAQKYVEQHLKAPSTAEFPALFKSSVNKNSSGIYSVSSYVYSQNSFGAMIRSSYVVELKQKEDGKITLVDLNITP
ncbi:MAG: hypothetical protein ABJN84_01650 [Flavobacteriaceae bacterium]